MQLIQQPWNDVDEFQPNEVLLEKPIWPRQQPFLQRANYRRQRPSSVIIQSQRKKSKSAKRGKFSVVVRLIKFARFGLGWRVGSRRQTVRLLFCRCPRFDRSSNGFAGKNSKRGNPPLSSPKKPPPPKWWWWRAFVSDRMVNKSLPPSSTPLEELLCGCSNPFEVLPRNPFEEKNNLNPHLPFVLLPREKNGHHRHHHLCCRKQKAAAAVVGRILYKKVPPPIYTLT